MALRVLHVMAGAPTGGAENIFLEDVLALADAPLEQFVVTRPNNDFRAQQLEHAGIGVATAPFDPVLRWRTSRIIRRVAAKFRPDIIQYWMGRAGTFAIRTKAKNVAWYGGYYKLRRFRRCDYHVGLTTDLIRHIVEQGVTEDRTALIHTYAEFPNAAKIDRALYTTPSDAPLLLALARLHWKKGLDVLLRSLARTPQAYLWIAGDGPLREELENLADELGVVDRVRFLGWRDDRGSLLKTADVCVFPSRYEPFGTVTVDAWASDVPLIAAAAAGPKAYVQHEENGLLVEIDDVDALTEAIQRIIDEPNLASKLVAGGRRKYQEQFTKDAFIRDSLAFYERIAGNQS